MAVEKGAHLGGVRTLEDLRIRCVMCDGCWLWRGALSSRKTEAGRPSVSVCGSSMTGRRAALMLAGVEIKPGHVAVPKKTCTENLCINPAHSEAISGNEHRKRIALACSWKTQAQKVIRGRKRRGSLAKLTPDQVREIRARPSERSDDLAAEFGVSRNTINDIRSGTTWRDVGGPELVANASVFAWRPAA